MDAAVDTGTNGKTRRRRSTARKDSSGQEAGMSKDVVIEKTPYLVKLHNSAKDAATDYSDGIKAIAEKAGVNAASLRAYVTAKAGDDFEEKKKHVAQMSFLFEIE